MKSKIFWSYEAFLIILVVAGMALVTFLIVIDSIDEKQVMDAKARCESVSGKLGYRKCFKNGKEIKQFNLDF